ncbi:hypothetical protein KIL84_005911 [Mauremys mutica]|uniref:Uncharacterized protein n=1 Tax=Mauremys mutica TaxID=74926 RepID=A0A9D3XHK6_9SAUR|nr:hypothetical protein KIL84_005911 [Mauremys mutica]
MIRFTGSAAGSYTGERHAASVCPSAVICHDGWLHRSASSAQQGCQSPQMRCSHSASLMKATVIQAPGQMVDSARRESCCCQAAVEISAAKGTEFHHIPRVTLGSAAFLSLQTGQPELIAEHEGMSDAL